MINIFNEFCVEYVLSFYVLAIVFLGKAMVMNKLQNHPCFLSYWFSLET